MVKLKDAAVAFEKEDVLFAAHETLLFHFEPEARAGGPGHPQRAKKAPALSAAGLRRVSVSLDTLNPEKFRAMTQRDNLDKVLEGLFAAKHYGLQPIKINAVIERGLARTKYPGSWGS